MGRFERRENWLGRGSRRTKREEIKLEKERERSFINTYMGVS
jgi:hypothetical protein